MVEKKKGFQIFAHFVMIFIAVCSVAPFILLVMSSITEEKSLIANGYSFFPKEFSLYAYQYLLTGSGALLRSYVISFIVTAVGTLSNLIITILYHAVFRRSGAFLYHVDAYLSYSEYNSGASCSESAHGRL